MNVQSVKKYSSDFVCFFPLSLYTSTPVFIYIVFTFLLSFKSYPVIHFPVFFLMGVLNVIFSLRCQPAFLTHYSSKVRAGHSPVGDLFLLFFVVVSCSVFFLTLF